MRLVTYSIGFVAMMIMMISCRKEKSVEMQLPSDADTQWEFQEGGAIFKGAMDTAEVVELSGMYTVMLSGVSDDGDGILMMQIAAERINPGEYTSPLLLFRYIKTDGTVLFENTPLQSNPFSIVINQLDSTTISGTFSGTVVDTSGNTTTITEGKFTALIDGASLKPQEPGGTGQLSVWSKTLCGNGGPIEVRIGDELKQITTVSASEPVCGSDAAATFTLSPGVYTVVAKCGDDSASVQIQILANNCTLLEVSFNAPEELEGDYLPLKDSWVYRDVNSADPRDTTEIFTKGETEINGKTYTNFVNKDTKDTSYYRKAGGVYYEAISSAMDFDIDPPYAELVMLREDAAEGDSWVSNEYTVSFSAGVGGSYPAKLKRTVTQRDFAAEINGRNYYNLIEVLTELLIKLPGRTEFEPSGSAYRTVFAKGIGIVYFEDLKESKAWGIQYYHVVPE